MTVATVVTVALTVRMTMTATITVTVTNAGRSSSHRDAGNQSGGQSDEGYDGHTGSDYRLITTDVVAGRDVCPHRRPLGRPFKQCYRQ